MKNHVNSKTSLSEAEEDLCTGIFRDIMRARHQWYQLAEHVAVGADLHAAELNVLVRLGRIGPISMGRLAKESFISPSNTTNTVKKLESTGLVSRQRSANSDREVTVSLTSKGKTVFRKCYPRILDAAHAHMSGQLTQGEMAKLARILDKLVAR